MAEFAEPLSIRQRYIVVDDDRMNNLVSKFIIKRYNKEAEILIYNDPELALAEIGQLTRSVEDQLETIILLDINMPMMSGWEFLEQFRILKLTIGKHLRIYMISSSIDSRDKKSALDHSLISGFFSKPLSVDHLRIASSDSIWPLIT